MVKYSTYWFSVNAINFAQTLLGFMAYHSPKSVKCMRVSMKLGILRFAEVNLTMPAEVNLTMPAEVNLTMPFEVASTITLRIISIMLNY